MPLAIRPHTVVVSWPEESVDGAGTVEGIYHRSPVSLRGKVEPLSPDSAIGTFGIAVDRPYRLMVNPDDGASVATVNALVEWGDLRLRVRAWRPFESVTSTTHWSILLSVEADA